MKNLRNPLVLSMAMVCFLLAGTAAKAVPFTITLDLPYQSGSKTLYIFDGTLTNTGGATLYLNGDLGNVNLPATLDDTPYFDNAPETLGAGDSWWGELFTVTTPGYNAEGSNIYTGSFTITGGYDGNAQDILGTADFEIQQTPEPSSLLLFGTGLRALGFLAGRKLIAQT
jgi:hypothetical protein